MDKYSELQSQAFQYHIERDELEESHKQKVNQLEAECRKWKLEIADKEQQIAELQRSADGNQELKEQAASISPEVYEQLQVQYMELTQNGAQLVEERAKLMERVSELEVLLRQGNEDSVQLSIRSGAEREAQNFAIVGKDAQIEHYQKELEVIQHQVELNNEKIIALHEELSAVRYLLETEQQSKGQLQDLLEESASECEALHAYIAEKLRLLTSLQEDNALIQSKLSDSEVELSNTLKSLERLQGEGHDMKRLYEESQRKITELQAELDSQSELDLSNIYEQQIKRLQRDYATLQVKSKEMEDQANRYKEQAEEIQSRRQEVQLSNERLEEELHASLAGLQQFREKSQKLDEELHLAADRIASLTESSKIHTAELNSALEEAKHAKDEANKLRDDWQASTEEGRKLREENSKLEEEVERCQQRVADLIMERDLLQSEIATWKQALADLKCQESETSHSTRILKEQLSSLQKENESGQQTRVELQDQIVTLEHKLAAVTEQLECAVALKDDADRRMQELDNRSSAKNNAWEVARDELLDKRILPT